MKTWKLLMSNNFSICWYNPTFFSISMLHTRKTHSVWDSKCSWGWLTWCCCVVLWTPHARLTPSSKGHSDKAEMNQGTGTHGFVPYLIQQGEVNFLQRKLILSQYFVKIEICHCGKAGQNIPGVLAQQELWAESEPWLTQRCALVWERQHWTSQLCKQAAADL